MSRKLRPYHPDGIAIVSDTRITVSEGNNITFEDGTLKVVSPRKDVAIAVAGNVHQLRVLLNPVFEKLRSAHPREMHDVFIRALKERYLELFEENLFTNSFQPNMDVIYCDVRKIGSHSRSRLASFQLGVRKGRPAIGIAAGKKLEWVSIGWTLEGRKFIGNRAADALCELESRSLSICDSEESGLKYTNSIDGRVLGILDSRGARTGTFRKTLRQFCNGLDSSTTPVPFEPMLIFGSAALKEIEYSIEEARNIPMPHVETVGSDWCLTTLTNKHGVFVDSSTDVAKIFV